MEEGYRVGVPQTRGYKEGEIERIEQCPDGQESALVQFDNGENTLSWQPNPKSGRELVSRQEGMCQYPDCVNMHPVRNRLTADVRPVQDRDSGQIIYLCKDHRYGRMS